MSKESNMRRWARDPATINYAVANLSPEDKASGLRILRALRESVISGSAEAGLAPQEWEHTELPELLDTFEHEQGEASR